MRRRSFLTVSAAAGLTFSAPAAGAQESRQFYDLRFYHLRTSKANQRRRLVEFLEKEHLPMALRLAIGPTGYFQVDVGADMPQIVTVAAYDSWAALESKRAAQQADERWTQALQQLGSSDDPAYDRVDRCLLRAFESIPRLEAPEVKEGQAPRLFDLRTYEGETERDSAEKIRMFDQEEIGIFRKSGIHPVLFGETLFGPRMPSLTYLVWYDDWRAREEAWRKFSTSPEWKRASGTPGWTDAEIVSNITHRFLRPLPFSPIR
jgi:hypothetical protein